MSHSNPQAKRPDDAHTRDEHDKADLHRRLRAAGLDPDGNDVPEDMDEFRYNLARRIDMQLNTWHGCPEGVCRRQRGCMAPDGICANAPPLPPDPDGVEWDKARFEIRQVLDELMAERGEG